APIPRRGGLRPRPNAIHLGRDRIVLRAPVRGVRPAQDLRCNHLSPSPSERGYRRLQRGKVPSALPRIPFSDGYPGVRVRAHDCRQRIGGWNRRGRGRFPQPIPELPPHAKRAKHGLPGSREPGGRPCLLPGARLAQSRHDRRMPLALGTARLAPARPFPGGRGTQDRQRASTRVYMFYTARNRTLVCVRNYRCKRLYLVADVLALFPLTATAEWLRSHRRRLALRWLVDARMDSLRRSLQMLREPVTV